jgi:NAD(P)-dependent dehydrogenase (short-subunit alcohol dehydrogenase family)
MDRARLTSLFDLSGRTAVVTGGTRGIGLAVAQAFAAAGANVVVASRKADACAEAASLLTAQGGNALGVPAHMGELADLANLVERTVERFGALDILVNNAANALAQPLGSFTAEAWEKSYAVNLRGPVFLVQEALPHLTASPHAAVVNVASVGAFMFSAGTSLYAGAKAALLSFTRSLAAELAPQHVRVNALAPGTVDTDMVRKNPPEVQERMASACLMHRAASPEEMAGPALFLASDASSYMTGQVLVVDGGLVAH